MTAREGISVLLSFGIALALVLGFSALEAQGQSPCYQNQYGQWICPQQQQQPCIPCQQQQQYSQPTYQPQPFVQQQPQAEVDRNPLHTDQPGPMDVGIEVPEGQTSEGFRTGMGSGVLAARSASGGTIALTNWHVGNSGYAYVVLSDGRKVRGQVVGSDKQNDLSAIDIPVSLQYTSIATHSPTGVTVTVRAFDNGVNFRKYEGITATGNTLLNAYSVGGNSGSGLYYQGRLVGILWGNRQNRLAYADVGAIRRLLDRVRAQYQVCDISVTTQVQQASDPGPEQSNATPLPNANCNCVEKFKAILARQDKLETDIRKVSTNLDATIDARIDAKVEALGLTKLPERGEPGPAGPRGPQGIQGEQGPPGKDAPLANTAPLEARITQLENQLAEIRANTPVSFDIVPKEN